MNGIDIHTKIARLEAERDQLKTERDRIRKENLELQAENLKLVRMAADYQQQIQRVRYEQRRTQKAD